MTSLVHVGHEPHVGWRNVIQILGEGRLFPQGLTTEQERPRRSAQMWVQGDQSPRVGGRVWLGTSPWRWPLEAPYWGIWQWGALRAVHLLMTGCKPCCWDFRGSLGVDSIPASCVFSAGLICGAACSGGGGSARDTPKHSPGGMGGSKCGSGILIMESVHVGGPQPHGFPIHSLGCPHKACVWVGGG